MSEKMPQKPTVREIAKLEKTRTISDANLLKDGAKYTYTEDDQKLLHPTKEQVKAIKARWEKIHGLDTEMPVSWYQGDKRGSRKEYIMKRLAEALRQKGVRGAEFHTIMHDVGEVEMYPDVPSVAKNSLEEAGFDKNQVNDIMRDVESAKRLAEEIF